MVTDGNSLSQFERAGRIRNSFFGRNQLGSKFSVTPIKLAPDTDRSLLKIGSETLDYYGQNPRTIRNIQWPGGDARLDMNGKLGNDTNYAPEGDWGLFRLFDKASTSQTLNGGTSAIVTFRENNNSVSYRLDTDSVDNPFTTYESWRNFRCPAKLW